MNELAATAKERLNAARVAVDEGRYAEALSEYIWFHHHALEEEPSLYGVRLSFALSYWLELAKLYPPARAALESIRDDKTQCLVEGAADRELFHDVDAINQALGNDQATYDLFCAINSQNPDFAARCARLAMPAMVKARDYKLARRFIADPEAAIELHASRFTKDIEWARRESALARQADTIDAMVHIYSEDVSMLAEIVRETGEATRAKAMVEHAIALAEDGDIRSAVRAAFGS